MSNRSTAKPKITIILPVYNVADFLPRCLDSIANQTFRDFCVIAVNDGATDRSPEILREFAAAHPWFTVVDQENQGLSAARNKGLSLARTAYISFIDSDDFVAPTFLEELYNACEQNDADIACCYYNYYYVETGSQVPHPFRCEGVFSRDKAIKKLLQDVQMQSYAWNKLYKRRLFDAYHITYPAMAFEDLATTHRLFQHANRVAVINRALYYYVQRKTSILKTPNPKKVNDFIRAAASVRLSLEKTGEFQRFHRDYAALCWKTALYCNYYVIKYQLTNKSVKGLPGNMRRVTQQLRRYKSSQFTPGLLAGTAVPSLPDTLPVEP